MQWLCECSSGPKANMKSNQRALPVTVKHLVTFSKQPKLVKKEGIRSKAQQQLASVLCCVARWHRHPCRLQDSGARIGGRAMMSA